MLQSLALGAAVLATVGLLTRVTLPLAWLAALPLVAMTSSLGKVVHNDVLLLLCLVPLLPSRAGAAWSLDARLRPVAGRGRRSAGRCGRPWWWWPGPTSSPAWPSCSTPARPGWPAATSAGCCTPPATASPSPTRSPCSSPTGRCSPTWSRRPPWPSSSASRWCCGGPGWPGCSCPRWWPCTPASGWPCTWTTRPWPPPWWSSWSTGRPWPTASCPARQRRGATMTAEADLLIVGAPVYTADPARPWADAVAVRAGRVAAAGPERDLAELRGPATRVLRLDGGLVLPGFADAHVHTAAGGLELAQCDLHEVEPEGVRGHRGPLRADHPDPLGPRRRLGHGRPAPAAPTGPRWTRWGRPAGAAGVHRRAQRLGQQPRPGAGRDHPRHPRPAAGRIETPSASRPAPSTRRPRPWSATSPPSPARPSGRPPSSAARPTCTARHHRLAGRRRGPGDAGRLPGGGRAGPAHRPGRGRPALGRRGGGAQLAGLVERRRPQSPGGCGPARSRSSPTGCSRTPPPPCSTPTWTATAARPATSASACSTPTSWPGGHRPGRRGLRRARPRHRRPGRPRHPGRLPGRRPPPTAAATPATRSPTSSSSTPTTAPASAASGWSPTPSRSGRAWTATCAS